MKSGPYSIYTDGSNDNGLKKMMPITVSVEDDTKELGISNEFLDICMTETSTAEGIIINYYKIIPTYWMIEILTKR